MKNLTSILRFYISPKCVLIQKPYLSEILLCDRRLYEASLQRCDKPKNPFLAGAEVNSRIRLSVRYLVFISPSNYQQLTNKKPTNLLYNEVQYSSSILYLQLTIKTSINVLYNEVKNSSCILSCCIGTKCVFNKDTKALSHVLLNST